MAGARILITEDELIVALEIEETLKKLGYIVVGKVTSGEEAILKAGELTPDLVMMDIRLDGEMDGITAAKRISTLYDIPIIFLTAHSDEATLKRAIDVSPSGYLLKPFNERELLTNIEMSLYKNKVRKKISEPPKNEHTVKDYLNSIPEPAFLISTSCTILDVNETGEKLLDKPSIQLKNKPLHSLFSRVSPPLEEKSPLSKLSPDIISVLPNQLMLSDTQNETPYSLSVGFIQNKEGILHSLVGTLTKSLSSPPSAHSSSLLSEFIRTIIANLPLPIFILDQKLIITEYNEAFHNLCNKLGIKPYQVEKPIFESFHGNFFGEISRYNEIFRTGNSHSEVKKYINPHLELYFKVFRFPIREDTQVIRVASIIVDVTDEIKAKNEIRNLNFKISQSMENIDDIIRFINTIKPVINDFIKESNAMGLKNSESSEMWSSLGSLYETLEIAKIRYEEMKERMNTQ